MNDDPIDLPSFAVPPTERKQFPDFGGPSEKKGIKDTRRMRRPTIPADIDLSAEAASQPPPAELVELLAQLEQSRVRLETFRGRMVEALPTAADMVEAAAAKARECQDPAETEGPPFVDADHYRRAARKLHKELSGSALTRLFSFAGFSRTAAPLQQQAQKLIVRLGPVLGGLFQVLEGHCRSPKAGEEWRQTYSLFLQEVQAIADELAS
jgi:hypothetical protein